MKKALAACLFFALLAGCSSGSPPPVKTVIGSTAKTNLDVLMIDVADQSLPPSADSPYSKNNFQPTISSAIQQWAHEHFAAAGPTGSATITVRDASLTSQALPYSKDMFTRKQASKYIAHAEVEIGISGHEGQGHVTAQASRFETLPENPTAIERQSAYTKVLNGLMHDLAINIDAAVRDHIGAFVITAPIISQ